MDDYLDCLALVTVAWNDYLDYLGLVTVACACPQCGERRLDYLIWNEEEQVECQTCGQVYDPNEQGGQQWLR
jgi:rubredoxin